MQEKCKNFARFFGGVRTMTRTMAGMVALCLAAGMAWGQTPGHGPTPVRSVAEEMAAVESALPATAWQLDKQPWTSEMFRKAATLLGERERAEKILERWQDGHSLVWTSRGGPLLQTALGVLRFKDA